MLWDCDFCRLSVAFSIAVTTASCNSDALKTGFMSSSSPPRCQAAQACLKLLMCSESKIAGVPGKARSELSVSSEAYSAASITRSGCQLLARPARPWGDSCTTQWPRNSKYRTARTVNCQSDSTIIIFISDTLSAGSPGPASAIPNLGYIHVSA